jgi:myo-inositol-hexaphosphate 3-phosphohydrolase
MYRNGLGVAKDDEQAFAWRRKAAEQENYDVRNAIELHDTRSRAEQGNAVAQFNLGVMYKYGLGVAQDDDQAVAWFRKAAEQGFAGAQYNLGVMYRGARAVAWLRKAADQGHSGAQETLRIMDEVDDLDRLAERMNGR